MKKIYFAALLVMGAVTTDAQKVYNLVDFNNYVSATKNDLTGSFSGNHRFTQSTSGGFTGGAVVVHDSQGAAPKYNHVLRLSTSPLMTSILFKYSRSLNTVAGLKSALLDFTTAGTDHIEFYADAQSVGFTSPDKSDSEPFQNGDTLADGHWYQLKVELGKKPDDSSRLVANVYLYHMGESSSSVPMLMAAKLGEVFTNYFESGKDLATLAFYANKRAGTGYLDNFTIYGVTLGISSKSLETRITVPTVIASTGLQVLSTLSSTVSYSLFDMQGRCLKSGVFNNKVTIDGSELAAGNYVIRFEAESSFMTKRVIKY